MRYSVLLPTRNGGKFLKACIESILAQDYDDFELVISDNANSDETPEIVEQYRRHPKVRAIRLDAPVGVTDNWNAAYSQSSGDYILMMGDDDYLLPGYFRTIDALLARHGDADWVLYNGYSFVAPGSIGGDPRAFYSPQHFHYAPDLSREHMLGEAQKSAIVRDIFRWKMRIPLNMQTAIVSRRAAERIPGGFYQPPFPDHYALNALLLMDAQCLFTPQRLVVVGVSPKSFGHYVYSGKQDSGLAYLGVETEFPGQLPGSPLLNGMHVWLDRLLDNFPSELNGVAIDRSGYVRRQAYNWLMQKKYGRVGWGELLGNFGQLGAADWARLALTAFDRESWRRLTASLTGGSAQAQWQGLRPLDDIADIAAFAAWVSRNKND